MTNDERIFRYIIKLIQDFESALPDDVEVGIVLDGIIYPFEYVALHRDYSLLTLSARSPEGRAVFLNVQPLERINLTLRAIPRKVETVPRRKIGFSVE